MIQILSLNLNLEAKKEGQTLLEIAFEAGLDWMHACGGKGKCTTCRFKMETGNHHLHPETEAEIHFRNLLKLRADERLACQCRIHQQAEISIRIPKSCRLSHLHYVD